MLAGVVDVGDVGGVRVERPVPWSRSRRRRRRRRRPGGSDPAAAQVFGFHQFGEGVLAVEGGRVAGGAGVHHRVAVVIEAGDGEEAGELDLAGAGLPSSPLPLRPSVSLGRTGRRCPPPRHTACRGPARAGAAGGSCGREPAACGPGRGAGRRAGRLGGPLDCPGAHSDPGRVGQQGGGLAERDLRAGPGNHLGQPRRQRCPGHAQLPVPWREAVPAFAAVVPGPLTRTGPSTVVMVLGRRSAKAA